MLAYDDASGSLWFGVNGVWSGDPSVGTGAAVTGLSGVFYPAVSLYDATARVIFAAGEFAYSIPAGFIVSEVE